MQMLLGGLRNCSFIATHGKSRSNVKSSICVPILMSRSNNFPFILISRCNDAR